MSDKKDNKPKLKLVSNNNGERSKAKTSKVIGAWVSVEI